MDCTKFRKLIDAVVDNEAAQIEREAVMAHVSSCPSCRTALSNLRTLSVMVRDAYPAEKDIDVTGAVMARIRAKQAASRESLRTPRPVHGRTRSSRYIVAAAAALVVGLAAFGAASMQSGTDQTVASAGDRLEPYVLEHVDRTAVNDLRSSAVAPVRFEN